MESQYKIKIKASTDTASFNEVKKSLDEALISLNLECAKKYFKDYHIYHCLLTNI